MYPRKLDQSRPREDKIPGISLRSIFEITQTLDDCACVLVAQDDRDYEVVKLCIGQALRRCSNCHLDQRCQVSATGIS